MSETNTKSKKVLGFYGLIRLATLCSCSIGKHSKIERKPVCLDVPICLGVLIWRDLCHDYIRGTNRYDVNDRRGSIFLAEDLSKHKGESPED